MRSQCQHTNSHLMEYRVISSDGHLSKHYALIRICTRYMSKLSFILFQSVIDYLERELFRYPEQPLQMPLSAHTFCEHWSISKNYYLCPELSVHLTHRTLRTQTDVLDAMSDRRRVRKIPLSSSHVLTPSGHGLFRPVRPDDVR